MLEEEPLNQIILEKTNLETYYYDKNEELKSEKTILLKDYYISNSVSTNKIYNNIQSKIIRESESIHEVPKRNYKLELNEFEAKKQLLFKRKNTNWDESVKGFNDLLTEIHQIIRECQMKNDEKEYVNFVDLYNSTKLTLATTYMYKQKYDMGKKLIDELIQEHPTYIRPYIKKFEYFHIMSEFENAKEFYDKVKGMENKLNEKDRVYFNNVETAFIRDYTEYEKVKIILLKYFICIITMIFIICHIFPIFISFDIKFNVLF